VQPEVMICFFVFIPLDIVVFGSCFEPINKEQTPYLKKFYILVFISISVIADPTETSPACAVT
jgi:hypothetical protein